MKAKPVRIIPALGYVTCMIEKATHVILNIPGPTGELALPIILKGSRGNSGCWTWNGDVNKPTLKPSVLTKGHDFRCHSWINDGQVKFLKDCSHQYAEQTIDLLEVPNEN